MSNLKAVLAAALKKKQADLDAIDDELSTLPEMAPDAPMDTAPSPEFDLLSDKREELEQEISKMQEGVQLISAWEEFKGGPWSEEIKGMLNDIDMEITGIAGGEPAPAGDLLGGPEAPDMAPTPEAAPLPEAPAAPATDQAPEAVPAPVAEPASAETPIGEPAPVAAPVASVKSPTSKKNIYQSPDKKSNSSPSSLKKEGSTMATETPSKPSLKEKLAEVKSKREAIKKEAQQRVAAAWTIAKTMLPDAPAETQKAAAAVLLQNQTPVLNAMLRQTAKNAHWSKFAETFKQVHKMELNDLLEDPSVLKSEKSSVESELKGEAKSAAAEKKADDRKDAGPQTETYNDGRGAGGGKHTEPKEMDAGTSASQTEAANRPANTVNKSEGEGKGKEASAAKKADECKCEGECKCAAKTASEAKTAKHECKCEGKCMCAEGKCKCLDKKAAVAEAPKAAAAAKKADDPAGEPVVTDAPAEAPAGDAAPAEDMGAAPPAELPPAEEAPAEDTAAEVLTDEKKMVVEEKIEEAQEAISALEKEILEESAEGEELDYSQIFNEDEMEDKVSSCANEGDEHTAGNGEEFFAPSAAENLEASLDDTQMASMEDFFSLKGSDSDPLAHLIAGGIKTAEQVAGMDIVESFSEAAEHFEHKECENENRDMENDHDGDLFAEAIKNSEPYEQGSKRVHQDVTNVLQAPKSAAKEAAPVIKKLKPVVASEKKPMDIAAALFGDDEN